MGDSGAADDDMRVLRTEDGLAGLRPDPQPLPNRADAAYDELTALRREAAGLGIEVDPAEPLAELRARVERARQERAGGA